MNATLQDKWSERQNKEKMPLLRLSENARMRATTQDVIGRYFYLLTKNRNGRLQMLSWWTCDVSFLKTPDSCYLNGTYHCWIIWILFQFLLNMWKCGWMCVDCNSLCTKGICCCIHPQQKSPSPLCDFSISLLTASACYPSAKQQWFSWSSSPRWTKNCLLLVIWIIIVQITNT